MADLDIVTGAQLADGRVVLKTLFSRLRRNLSREHVRGKPPLFTTYDFTHPQRGLAIVISNGKFLSQDPRPYANVEIANMRTMFQKLYFEVLAFQDLTKKQMLSVLEDAAKLKDYHHQSDCFACVIGSHGAEIPSGVDRSSGVDRPSAPHETKHVIYGTDKQVDTNRLTDLFSDSNCPGLRHKPKLFFIQACRKDSTASPNAGIDTGVDINITSAQPPTPSHTPIFALTERGRKPERDSSSCLGSVNAEEANETVEQMDMDTVINDSTIQNETTSPKKGNDMSPTASKYIDMGPTSPKSNAMSPTSPKDNDTHGPISPKDNDIHGPISPKDNDMSPTSPKDNDTHGPISPKDNVISLTMENIEKSRVEEVYVQQTTDQPEFLNAVRKFSLLKLLDLNSSVDEQLSPVCRQNFMIMYSSAEGMYSFGRREEGGMTRIHNPVVGGFLLHSLYSVVIRENLFFLQNMTGGLDMLEVFTRVNDFGSKNLLAKIELHVGGNEEDKQRFNVKSAFALEHRLTGDVIFERKNTT